MNICGFVKWASVSGHVSDVRLRGAKLVLQRKFLHLQIRKNERGGENRRKMWRRKDTLFPIKTHFPDNQLRTLIAAEPTLLIVVTSGYQLTIQIIDVTQRGCEGSRRGKAGKCSESFILKDDVAPSCWFPRTEQIDYFLKSCQSLCNETYFSPRRHKIW